MKKKLNKKKLYSWIWVLLFSIVIFLTVPVATTFQTAISRKFGKQIFIYFVLSFFTFVFIYLVYFLVFKLKVNSISNYIWLLIVASLYVYFTLKLQNSPAEALHFLEYGFLGFLIFRASKYNIKDKSIYFTVTLFGLLIGTLDEMLQWITPQRFWDFQDVGLNALSCGLLYPRRLSVENISLGRYKQRVRCHL